MFFVVFVLFFISTFIRETKSRVNYNEKYINKSYTRVLSPVKIKLKLINMIWMGLFRFIYVKSKIKSNPSKKTKIKSN